MIGTVLVQLGAGICPLDTNKREVKNMEWLTYSRECGFNIVEASCEGEAENTPDCTVLDAISEVDSQIISRIRELIK